MANNNTGLNVNGFMDAFNKLVEAKCEALAKELLANMETNVGVAIKGTRKNNDTELPGEWVDLLKNQLMQKVENNDHIISFSVGIDDIEANKQVRYVANIAEYGMGQKANIVNNRYLGAYQSSGDYNSQRPSDMTILSRSDVYYDVRKDALVQGKGRTNKNGEPTQLKGLAHPGGLWFENALLEAGGEEGLRKKCRNIFEESVAEMNSRMKQYIG